MDGKTTKNKTKEVAHHQFEYVPSAVLNYLIGSTKGSINANKGQNGNFKQVGYIMAGSVRKFSFSDTAKLAYPELTNYEIAKLRVDINEKILERQEKNKAEKSRSKE